MALNDLTNKVVNLIFVQFDSNQNDHLSKFEFASSLNHLSKKVGGSICPRTDLQYIFELIDQNGDQTISKREYKVLIHKFAEVLKKNGGEAYQKFIKFSERKLEDVNTRYL